MAVLYFGASHVQRGIYMLPDGEYCSANGTLIGQDVIDGHAGIYGCWGCLGAGLVKMYLGRGYSLVQCDICHGERTSGLLPKLQPRHIHDWQPSEDKALARFEPQWCECGAAWLKKRERASPTAAIGGMMPVGALLAPAGGTEAKGREGGVT